MFERRELWILKGEEYDAAAKKAKQAAKSKKNGRL
jgi:hypothetical protein